MNTYAYVYIYMYVYITVSICTLAYNVHICVKSSYVDLVCSFAFCEVRVCMLICVCIHVSTCA